ncbi:MAG: efflux RND transporter periplasmic adaptor subunit, partial [Anaerolineales bacterium]
EEGQRVTADQLLVKLDDALLLAQRGQAVAGLQAAQTNQALLQSGASEEQIRAAEAQLAQAEANLRMVQANLTALTIRSRPEEIDATFSSLEQARDAYREMTVVLTSDQIEEVRSALSEAEDNLSAAIAHQDDNLAAEAQMPDYAINAAAVAVTDAQTVLEAAKQAYEGLTDGSLPFYRQIERVRLSWDVARAAANQARARRDGLVNEADTPAEALVSARAILRDAQDQEKAAQEAYEAVTSGLSGIQLKTAWEEVQRSQRQLNAFGISGQTLPVETLLAQIDAAEALREGAEANLTALENGARQEQLEAAQAQVDAAQAQLDALDIQLDKFILTAPWEGIVLSRSAEPGGTVMPGAPLLTVGLLDRMELTIYLPEERFGLITPGDEARVTVDAYPDRVFTGTVLRVADEAEFTPTNIQTKEERVRLVYAVVISLDNPDLALKPGMIADVELGE